MGETEATTAAPPLPIAEREGVTVADWSRREFALREWMDEPCTFATYREAARDLAVINRLTRGYAPTLRFLERVMANRRAGYEPLHVVDVGCAQGDGLRTISRWASKRSLQLKLTGVDINPYAARLAREGDREEHVSAGEIRWVTADAFAMALEQPPDVVISSLFAHHLPDESIVRFLRWSEANAKVGWLVSDLRRSERATKLYRVLTSAIGSCAMVKHDGVMSFRRALSLGDWSARCAEAQVDARVVDVGLGRVAVERVK